MYCVHLIFSTWGLHILSREQYSGLDIERSVMERSSKQKFQVTLGPFQLLLVLALIAGSYYMGNLQAKVAYLQNGGSAGTVVPSQAGTGQPAVPQAPLTADNVPHPTKDDWVFGDRNAQIALIEYSDLECPFCKQFHPTAQQIVEQYDGKVMWVFRHYPLSFHANAQKEAEAAQCAGKLGGNDSFWKYIDTIYERTTATGTGFALDKLVPLAKEIGLNESKFQDCLDSGEMAAGIKDEMDKGTQAGVTGTPGNILLNIKTGETELIPGAVPLEQLKPTIDKWLAS